MNPSMPPCHFCGAAPWRYFVSGCYCAACYAKAVAGSDTKGG